MAACATAEHAASFGIMTPYYRPTPEHDARVIERYIRYITTVTPAPEQSMLSDTRPESSIQSPSRIAPQWLTAVQDRIYSSIVPKGREMENDGRWLRRGVAEVASRFFQVTADLLPGEPHIYGSQVGDLVAEFDAAPGSMTAIVTPAVVILFAVADGVPFEKRLVLGSESSSRLRLELKEFVERLHTGQHGLETTN